jgi:hypothetical protein
MTGPRRTLAVLLASAIAAGTAAPADAAPRSFGNKGFWGPSRVIGGESAFPLYRSLGVTIFETGFSWDLLAPTKPANPRDPADPAYRWPADLDFALSEAEKYDMDVLVLVRGAPQWANGDHNAQYAPLRDKDYADFLTAASKRFPGVRFWQVWGEPSSGEHFLPLTAPPYPKPLKIPLTRAQSAAPRRYARLLDSAYVALKRADRRDVVVGGNTFSGGAILPLDWIRAMRMPNGRPPRMDMYGHNPFTQRPPNLADGQLIPGLGWGDFSDLDLVARYVDRYQTPRSGKKLKLFLAEFTLNTDRPSTSFNFWVTPEVQAQWVAAALRITRSWRKVYAFGWINLYDDPPAEAGNEVRGGLFDWRGRRKPVFNAFKRG